MMLLVFIILSSSLPVIFGQNKYHHSSDSNDEPFLPIYPIYPYNPKLMKRGIEKDFLAQFNSNFFTQKESGKDLYPSTTQNIYHSILPNQAASTSPSSSSSTPAQSNSLISPHFNLNPYHYNIFNGYPVAIYATTSSPSPPPSSSSPTPPASSSPSSSSSSSYNANNYQSSIYYPNQSYMSSNSGRLSNTVYSPEPVKNIESPSSPDDFTSLRQDNQSIDGMGFPSISSTLMNKDLDQMAINLDGGSSDIRLRSAQYPRTMIKVIGFEKQQQPTFQISPALKFQLEQMLAASSSAAAAVANNLSLDLKPPSPVPNTPVMTYFMPTNYNSAPRHIPKTLISVDQLLDPLTSGSGGGSVDKNQKPVTTQFYLPPLRSLKGQLYNDYNDYNQQVQSNSYQNSAGYYNMQQLQQQPAFNNYKINFNDPPQYAKRHIRYI